MRVPRFSSVIKILMAQGEIIRDVVGKQVEQKSDTTPMYALSIKRQDGKAGGEISLYWGWNL